MKYSPFRYLHVEVCPIRTTTKPSTAKCDKDTYTLYLRAVPKYAGCTRLAEILEDLSHDSVRFLLWEDMNLRICLMS